MSIASKNLPRRMASKTGSRYGSVSNPPPPSDPGLPGSKVLSQFEAEHLSTLVTSANRPPPDPESSLRRLRQLAENQQLTITPVNLVLQEYNFKRELLVTNAQNGEVCERIQVEEITSPIYKESNDPTDSYNNLLMFNVNANPSQQDGPSQHEMHIFQCLSDPAHVVVDTLQEPEGYNPQIYGGQSNNYDWPTSFWSEEGPYGEDDSTIIGGNGQYTEHQMSEKALVDKEILLLNMCFDDIESYVGHILQLNRTRSINGGVIPGSVADDNVSVNAGDTGKKGRKEKKEKKRRFIFKRRSSSTNGKSKDMPRVTSNASLASEVEIQITEDELKDLFEKVKFSIILLSRLQGYVTEPNPPFLTHKLFSMMRQPVDFVRDPGSGRPEMVQKIISPLFTEAAVTLIQGALIEPELSLWHELGDGWCLPREQWREDVPNYIPKFKCGFVPLPSEYHPTLFQITGRKLSNGNSSTYTQGLRAGSNSMMQTHEQYLNFLRGKRAQIARVKRDFLGESDQELSLKAGEYVEVLDDSRNWNRVRNRKGGDGYAPFTILDYNVV